MNAMDKMQRSAARPRMLLLVVAAVLYGWGTTANAQERSGNLLAGILSDSYQSGTLKRIIGRSSARTEKPVPAPAKITTPAAVVNANQRKRLAPYDDLIARYSAEYNVDADLIRAVIFAESGGDPHAVSPKGAVGLMQLMPATAAGLGVKDSFDPEQNIASGTRYLSVLIERFQSVPVALWAYNAGPQAVKAGRMPLATQNYVPHVLRLKRQLAQSGGE